MIMGHRIARWADPLDSIFCARRESIRLKTDSRMTAMFDPLLMEAYNPYLVSGLADVAGS